MCSDAVDGTGVDEASVDGAFVDGRVAVDGGTNGHEADRGSVGVLRSGTAKS